MKTAVYSRGFNLLELMIVVVIIGILAAFAYPSYVEHTRKSRRSDAQTALLRVAALQEKFYSDCTSYAASLAGAPPANCATGELGLEVANPESPEGYYRLTLEPGNIDSPCVTIECGFKIIADPVPGGAQNGDGALRIDGTGRREWNRNGAGTWVSWTAK